MPQKVLEREVASRTGETVATIRQRGFSVAQSEFPPPLVVNWDEIDQERLSLLPDRQRGPRTCVS